MSSALSTPGRFLHVLKINPTLLAVLTVLYSSVAVGFLLYQFERKQALESERKTQRLQQELVALSERQSHIDYVKTSNVDIFEKLAFKERSTPAEQEKLQAALTLNSYAKYALSKNDLQKAKETLDQSLKTYPTLEGQYYSGVVDYLNGNNQSALGSWTRLTKSPGVPDDIYVYMSLAEYRARNTEAAKKYADMYARSH